MEIKIEMDSLEKSDFSIVGIIFVETEDGSKFPGEGWYDFPTDILGWWLGHIVDLLNNPSSVVELLFMDGPQFMRVSMGENADIFEVSFVKPIVNGDGVISTHSVNARKFAENLALAARGLLQACESKNWQTKKLTTLQDNLHKLMKVLESK